MALQRLPDPGEDRGDSAVDGSRLRARIPGRRERRGSLRARGLELFLEVGQRSPSVLGVGENHVAGALGGGGMASAAISPILTSSSHALGAGSSVRRRPPLFHGVTVL